MKIRYYMITIDKCKKDVAPTKNDFKVILFQFKIKLQFNLENLFCYEYKINKWIHYHGIISSKQFLNYTDFKKTGYSFKIKYLKTTIDLLGAIRYINKCKIDKVDCQLNNQIFINNLAHIYS